MNQQQYSTNMPGTLSVSIQSQNAAAPHATAFSNQDLPPSATGYHYGGLADNMTINQQPQDSRRPGRSPQGAQTNAALNKLVMQVNKYIPHYQRIPPKLEKRDLKLFQEEYRYKDATLYKEAHAELKDGEIDLDEGRSSPKVGDHHHQMDAILMGLLQDLPQGLDTADESGNATIHIAAQHGNLELVNYLLREGANANLINTTGATPLAVSCYLDFFSVPIAHALIGKGARVALPVDMSGGGAFEESSGEAAMPMSALHHAVNSYREGVEGGVEMLRLLVGTSPHEHLAVLRTMFAESQGDECVVCLCEGGQQHADLETCLRITA